MDAALEELPVRVDVNRAELQDASGGLRVVLFHHMGHSLLSGLTILMGHKVPIHRRSEQIQRTSGTGA